MERKKTSPVWKISKEDLIKLVDKNETLGGVLSYFGMKNHGSNYKTINRRFEKDGIDCSKFKNNFGKGAFRPLISLDQILVKDSTFSRTVLKKRLLEIGMLKNECSKCNLKGSWNGEPIVMVLDHINGVNNDHRIKNLRMLCPNCNSQTDTFAGKCHKKMYNCKICGKEILKNSKCCVKCQSKLRNKIKWPSKEDLQILLWEKPMTKIAQELGVSDKAIDKKCKKYGLKKPVQGYWLKK